MPRLGEGKFLVYYPGYRFAYDPGARKLTEEEFGWIKEALAEYSWTRSPKEGTRMMALAVELGYVERQNEIEE